MGAFGALSAGLPEAFERWFGISFDRAMDSMFLVYAGLGVATMLLYYRLSPRIEPPKRKIVPLLDHRKEPSIVWQRCSAWIRSRVDSPCSRCWRCGCS